MDPINRNVLHRIKRVNEVEDLGELNDYLELGWILLNIRNLEDGYTYYLIGWPSDNEEPPHPESVQRKQKRLLESLYLPSGEDE